MPACDDRDLASVPAVCDRRDRAANMELRDEISIRCIDDARTRARTDEQESSVRAARDLRDRRIAPEERKRTLDLRIPDPNGPALIPRDDATVVRTEGRGRHGPVVSCEDDPLGT